MSGARYKRGGLYAADMAVYARALSEENTNEESLRRLKFNLMMALRQELTPKQLEYIRLYYAERLNTVEISQRRGVCRSTVSRTIHRGEATLRRCLRYGAANLLEEVGVKAPNGKVAQLAKREGYENMGPPPKVGRTGEEEDGEC